MSTGNSLKVLISLSRVIHYVKKWLLRFPELKVPTEPKSNTVFQL